MTSAERASVMLAVAQRIDHVCSCKCRNVRELAEDEANSFDANIIACMCSAAMRAGLYAARGDSSAATRELAALADLATAYADLSRDPEDVPFPAWLPIDADV